MVNEKERYQLYQKFRSAASEQIQFLHERNKANFEQHHPFVSMHNNVPSREGPIGVTCSSDLVTIPLSQMNFIDPISVDTSLPADDGFFQKNVIEAYRLRFLHDGYDNRRDLISVVKSTNSDNQHVYFVFHGRHKVKGMMAMVEGLKEVHGGDTPRLNGFLWSNGEYCLPCVIYEGSSDGLNELRLKLKSKSIPASLSTTLTQIRLGLQFVPAKSLVECKLAANCYSSGIKPLPENMVSRSNIHGLSFVDDTRTDLHYWEKWQQNIKKLSMPSVLTTSDWLDKCHGTSAPCEKWFKVMALVYLLNLHNFLFCYVDDPYNYRSKWKSVDQWYKLLSTCKTLFKAMTTMGLSRSSLKHESARWDAERNCFRYGSGLGVRSHNIGLANQLLEAILQNAFYTPNWKVNTNVGNFTYCLCYDLNTNTLNREVLVSLLVLTAKSEEIINTSDPDTAANNRMLSSVAEMFLLVTRQVRKHQVQSKSTTSKKQRVSTFGLGSLECTEEDNRIARAADRDQQNFIASISDVSGAAFLYREDFDYNPNPPSKSNGKSKKKVCAPNSRPVVDVELEIDETSNRVESEDDEVPQLVHDIAESTKSSITNELRTIISAGNLGDMTTNDMIMLIENKFGIELAKQNKIWFKKVVHDVLNNQTINADLPTSSVPFLKSNNHDPIDSSGNISTSGVEALGLKLESEVEAILAETRVTGVVLELGDLKQRLGLKLSIDVDYWVYRSLIEEVYKKITGNHEGNSVNDNDRELRKVSFDAIMKKKVCNNQGKSELNLMAPEVIEVMKRLKPDAKIKIELDENDLVGHI